LRQREQINELTRDLAAATARVGELEARRFPILHGPSIPWAIIAACEHQAQINHGQTIERLADRGGLDPSEAVAVLTGKRWSRDLVTPNVINQLLAIVHERTEPDLRTRLAAAEGRAEFAEHTRQTFENQLNDKLERLRESDAQVATLRAALERIIDPTTWHIEDRGIVQHIKAALATTDPSGLTVVREAMEAMHVALLGFNREQLMRAYDALVARFGTGVTCRYCRTSNEE
jgi:hypothetical protein